jgi:hypothetical protein
VVMGGAESSGGVGGGATDMLGSFWKSYTKTTTQTRAFVSENG